MPWGRTYPINPAFPEATTGGRVRATPPAPRTPAPGMVSFFALDGSMELVCLMGNGPAQLTGGIGGWQEEARRGLSPATWWDSPSSYRQAVPVLFEGPSSQEGPINMLWRMARSPGGRVPPPALIVTGPAVHRADLTWVIEGLDWGSNVIRKDVTGDRVRQDVTVNLLQYSEAETIVERSPSNRAASQGASQKATRGPTTYRVKEGDNGLAQIAARPEIYGDASQWKRIANANGIRDPKAIRVGQVLKIPR